MPYLLKRIPMSSIYVFPSRHQQVRQFHAYPGDEPVCGISMPIDARVYKTVLGEDRLIVWAVTNPRYACQQRLFVIQRTGDRLPDVVPLRYLCSTRRRDKHVFEVKDEIAREVQTRWK